MAFGAGVRPAAAQDAPLRFVNDQTEVGSVGFRFTETRTLDVADLQLQLATVPPGLLDRIRRRFDLIPGEAGVYPFRPVEVQKDVVRLERYYARSGFPLAAVDYEARLDSSSNLASVTFVINEGPPRLLEQLTFVGQGRQPVEEQLDAELHEDWARFTERPAVRVGERLAEVSLLSLQNATLAWLRQRGYAFADAGAEQFVDSTGLSASVRIKVTAGPRARYETIEVEGEDGIPERVILRELPFKPGDRYDARELGEGQRELFGLGLFQLALVENVPDQPRDSTVAVRVRLRRGPSRVVTGFAGYFSDGGITGRAGVTHRNLLGGAQQLTAGVEARTGILGIGGRAVSGGPIRDISISTALRQPYFFGRRLSAVVQPSYRIRDDEFETSTTGELLGTVLYSRSSLRTAAASVAGRYVDLSRGQGLRLLDPLGLLPTDSLQATTIVPSFDVTWGQLDNTLQPRAGAVVRPSLSGAFGDLSYGRGSLAVSALLPVTERVGVSLRLNAGALMASGATNIDTGRDYVLLRDRLFYSGGTTDVRGWATNLLGPKAIVVTPDTTGFAETGQSTLRGNGDVNYTGIGGRGKLSASVQLNLPLPLGPRWGSSVFLDAGRVARPSTAPSTLLLRTTGNVADAQLADILDREGGVRMGAGAGLQYLTPVGFVSFAVGVKLNPSYLDLRNAANVYCGNEGVVPGEDDAQGNPTSSCLGGYVDARKNNTTFDEEGITARPILNRIQFHLSIGQTF
ncbi:MAG TPA: BamA/TamA family outer membrane protein [Rubricoccaceae bacterium]|jgi:outer membrane protein insertion porin family